MTKRKARLKEERYVVQVIEVREFEVEALDDIQAELEAFRKMKPSERDGVILTRVLADGQDGNGIWDDPRKAIESGFGRPDMDWINASI